MVLTPDGTGMTGAAILAIVVATSEINDPATVIMIGAAGETLGPEVAIRLLGASQPEESDPLRIERETGAGAVVSLVWRDASRLRARIRLHVAASGHTTTRDLVFSEADTRVERGRTLGLAAASMWPEIRGPAPAEAAHASASPPPAAPPSPPEPSTPVAPVVAPPVANQDGSSPARATEPIRKVQEPSTSPAVARFALGLGGLGASGAPRSVGARLESAFAVGGSWALRVALNARTGPLPKLIDGRLWTFALAGGVEWWPVPLRAAGLVRFGMRADAIVMRHQVSGAVAGDPNESQGRFLPAFDLLVQTALRAGARVDLVAAAGAEAQPGGTDIRTGEPPVVALSIPPFQLVAEVGLRVGF